jgi:muramoyltetrapeptide carboxypeptidase
LEEAGFRVKIPAGLYAAENQFAGSDEERAKNMQTLLDDAEVKAILIARGGYGSVRIIDRLDFSNFCDNPKWICGFSDVTVFHNHLHTVLQVQSLHSLMPLTFPKEESGSDSLSYFVDTLSGRLPTYHFPPHSLNRTGNADGVLTGGNLSILCSLSGSISDIDTRGKILFIEDLDEYLYHIDRMMQNLKRSGKLSELKALIVGGMTEMRDNTIPFGKTAEEIIAETVSDYSYPLIFNVPAGHTEPNFPLMLGAKVQITCGNGMSRLVFT